MHFNLLYAFGGNWSFLKNFVYAMLKSMDLDEINLSFFKKNKPYIAMHIM